MQTQIQPYLFFEGRTEEALELYKKTLGAKVEMMMKFKDNPEPNPEMCPPGSDELMIPKGYEKAAPSQMPSAEAVVQKAAGKLPEMQQKGKS